MGYHETIDREIAAFLRSQKMTQAALAEKLGMTENTLRWKREGKTEFRLDEIMKLSQISGRTLNQLCGVE